GVAFDRASGDLIELDRPAFAALTALRTAHSLPALQRSLRHLGQDGCRSELIAILRSLERGGFVRRVAPGTPKLPEDRWTADGVKGNLNGLRAPLVAHWAVTYR